MKKWQDLAADGLIIERAKNFQAYLGSYSHLEEFTHAGPINLYYYAFSEKPFRFFTYYHGTHMLAQFILNCLFMMYALHVIYRYMKPHCLTFLFTFLLILGLVPLGNQFHFSVWTNHRVVAPTVAFFFAATCIAVGNFKHILPFAIATTFLIQNTIGTCVFVFPISALALIMGFVRVKRHKSSSMTLNWKYLLASIVFLAIAFAPVVIEQLTAEEGNISKICRFLVNQPTFEHHKFNPTVRKLLSCYLKPIMMASGIHAKPIMADTGIPFPLHRVLPTLPFLLISSLLIINYTREKNRYVKTATLLLLLFPLITLYYMLYVRGPQYRYLFFYFYTIVGISYFFALYTLIKLTKIDSLRISASVFVTLSLVGIFWLTLGRLKMERLTNMAPSNVDQIIEFIKPSTEVAYVFKWKKDGKHHMQWQTATGLALELTRQGYKVYAPDEWLFMFGKSFAMANRDNKGLILPIYLFNPDVTESEISTLSTPDSKMYRDDVTVLLMSKKSGLKKEGAYAR